MSPKEKIEGLIAEARKLETLYLAAFPKQQTIAQRAVLAHLQAGITALETSIVEFDNFSAACTKVMGEL